MGEAVLASLITGGLSLLGVVMTCMATAHKTETALKINQAVTDTRLTALTDEVRKHNGFAERIPVLEEKIRVLNHRVEDLERETSLNAKCKMLSAK